MTLRIEIEHKSDGWREVLFSQGVSSLVTSTANGIAARAGDGFTVSTIKGGFGGGRPVAFVSASTPEALIAETEDKAMTRAVNSGRLS